MIQSKPKICSICGKLAPLWRSNPKTCKECHQKTKVSQNAGKAPISPYRTKEIKKVSTRQQKLNEAYSAQRRVYLKNNPYCKACPEMFGDTGVSQLATDIHHRKGRGEYLLDETTWMPVCRACHQFIETHPAWAKEKGFSESRLGLTD